MAALSSLINREIMVAVAPNGSTVRINELLPHLITYCNRAGITTPLRVAAFLAQVAHESANFNTYREYASGAAYEGRRDLGNIYAGDGVKFRGRGLIQVTGRANYTECSKALFNDLRLLTNPGILETPEYAVACSTWYWTKRKLNIYADLGQFDAITKAINGGYNGKADRDKKYNAALNYFKKKTS